MSTPQLPAMFKAAVFEKPHAPLVIKDVPLVPPGPGEVLVKLVAAAINPVDWYVQRQGAPFATYPFMGGYDGAGVVEELGPDVAGLEVGDKMYVLGWV